MNNAFNHPIHAFRGFAILNVIAIHMFAFVLYISEGTAQPSSFSAPIYGALSSIIFHDATIYFTIISSLLFFTLLSLAGPSSSPLALYQGDVATFINALLNNLILGHAIPTFWYIRFY